MEMEPVLYEATPLVPVKMLPCAHEEMVVVPPFNTVAPPSTPTAIGTLLSLMLSRTIEPSRVPVLAAVVRKKMGVLDTTASMIASAPTPCEEPSFVPIVMSKPDVCKTRQTVHIY